MNSLTPFQLTDWLAHTPKDVIAKNFGTSLSAWNDIPGEQLYIFPGSKWMHFFVPYAADAREYSPTAL